MNEHTRPLISFVLFAYNQQQYVRDAILGAFSQTYIPLEIILSDDCSADNTFDIMQEMAGNYKGPHTVILNRNPTNLGIGAHINCAMNLVRGELIVGAAGDDVSFPERTEVTYIAWLNSEGNAMTIYTDAQLIDENGKNMGERVWAHDARYSDPLYMVRNDIRGIPGCTHAWHRSTFDNFGPLLQGLFFEDNVIPFRSALLGTIVKADAKTVLYRRHPGTVSGRGASGFLERLLFFKRQFVLVYVNCLVDYLKYSADTGNLDWRIVVAINAKITEFSLFLKLPENVLSFLLKRIMTKPFFSYAKYRELYDIVMSLRR